MSNHFSQDQALGTGTRVLLALCFIIIIYTLLEEHRSQNPGPCRFYNKYTYEYEDIYFEICPYGSVPLELRVICVLCIWITLDILESKYRVFHRLNYEHMFGLYYMLNRVSQSEERPLAAAPSSPSGEPGSPVVRRKIRSRSVSSHDLTRRRMEALALARAQRELEAQRELDQTGVGDTPTRLSLPERLFQFVLHLQLRAIEADVQELRKEPVQVPEPCLEARLRRARISKSNVPWDEYSNLLCPISGEPMKDPVTIELEPPSHVFDREHILRWFTERKTNPLTNIGCVQGLVDAVSIRKKIDALLNEDVDLDERAAAAVTEIPVAAAAVAGSPAAAAAAEAPASAVVGKIAAAAVAGSPAAAAGAFVVGIIAASAAEVVILVAGDVTLSGPATVVVVTLAALAAAVMGTVAAIVVALRLE